MNAQITSNRDTGDVSVTITSPAAVAPAVAESETESPSSSLSSSLSEVPVATSATDTHITTLKIECVRCGTSGPEGGARAYVKGPEPLSIVLCANRLRTQEEVEEVLIHELVHVYDVRVRNMDLRDCRELAHSEVRAAREAECHDTASLFKDYCVRRKATLATQNMFPGKQGSDCVCDVFDKALRDLEPVALLQQGRGAGTGDEEKTTTLLRSKIAVPSDR